MHNPRSIFTTPEQYSSNHTKPSTSGQTSPVPEHFYTPEKRNSGARISPEPSQFTTDFTFKKPSVPEHSDSRDSGEWRSGPDYDVEPLQRPSASSQKPSPAESSDVSGTPSKQSRKRSLEPDRKARPHPSSEPSKKRPRLHQQLRHTFDHYTFTGPSINSTQPPSPLFFSNSPRPRPQLPPRFSSSEAAARMLSKTRNEDSGIKTVHLARGTLSGSSPMAPTSIPGTRASVDRGNSLPLSSPDSGDSLLTLSQIGIMELLEQDERPTFIIDLADSRNYTSGLLQILFANQSLRFSSGLLEMITGKHPDESPGPTSPRTFLQFKSWLLSASQNGQSLDVCLPSFAYRSVSWSCSTLRKRLRICSGNYAPMSSGIPSRPASIGIPSSSATGYPSSSRESMGAFVEAHGTEGPIVSEEPQDYFGSAALPPTTDTPATSTGGPVDAISVSEASGVVTEAPKSEGAAPITPMTADTLTNQIANVDLSVELQKNPSLANECVLRAATAGNVDPFFSAQPPKDVGFFDWTRLPISDDMPPHIQFTRSVDWAATSLGPIEFWSSDLRQMCNLIMASPHPAAMYWGEDLIAIYNEAYVLLAGQKHPKLMGQSYKEAWAEIWDEVKGVFASAKLTGEATMKDDDCLFIKRRDFLEETYFSWSIIPMVGGDGSVMGLYNPAFEKTRRKVAERRMLTLREVGERTAVARDIKSFWEQVLKALDTNDLDTPFVLLYSVSDDSDSDSSSIHSSSLLGSKQCYLEGTLGVPCGHLSAPEQIELKTGVEGFGPVFREVMKTDKPVLLDVGTRDLPAEMLEGIEWRGFGDACRAVVVCPIHPTTGETILGFLVLGVNPRRPYDDDYNLFVQLLSRQLATSLASVVLFEEEIRRGQRAAKLAALDRIELSEQLAARTQEAIENETRFTRMAELTPIGMFIADSEGHITYCNDTWYEVSRVPKDIDSTDRWIDSVMDEDKQIVRDAWYNLVENRKSITAEFRFKAPWSDPKGNFGETWVLFSAYAETYDNGTLKSIFGSITNISQQKWAEGFQKRRMEEAIELKRQQENFIDITSHEMRNPLSAILQCADEISSSLQDFRKLDTTVIDPELVSSNIDAAQTIALCAQHQKRIVDDVLTLSKLDSAMLLVTPVDVQPLTVVQRALKMFEGELQTSHIDMKFIVDDSFKQLSIDWVRLDPSRVLQILINLTTNAIKFTTTESKKNITVTLAASLEPPSKSENRLVNYFPTRSKRVDMTDGADWGGGEVIYVQFAVQDTGRGLSEEEKKLLFLRFSQTSPRTHVQYGGSGLGLFISRELTELQGGEIGVASEAGHGSTFAFYVKARRSSPPKEELEPGQTTHLNRQPSDANGKSKPSPGSSSIPITKTKDFATSSVSATSSVAAAAQKQEKQEKERNATLKVLIVEDNLVNQRVLQKQLKNIGCVVHVANHGGEALDILRESRYWKGKGEEAIELSVVLMDQEMPVMDGITCTKRIRELEQEGKLTSHVPIIAVTANARTEQIARAMEAGMDDVVSKPFRIPELIPKIELLVSHYSSRTENLL